MNKLGFILIALGILIGPLLTVRSMWGAQNGIERGQGEVAIQTGISQAMTATFAGLVVAAIGFVILVVGLYRGRNNTVRTSAAD